MLIYAAADQGSSNTSCEPASAIGRSWLQLIIYAPTPNYQSFLPK